MATRRSVLGALAAALAPSAARPVADRTEAGGPSPVQLGAISALDVIPAELHAAIRAQRPTPDLAVYLNRAVAQLSARPGGGTLYLPQGTYPVSELDLTQVRASENGVTVVGAGRQQTVLRALVPDRVMVNMVGRDHLTLRDLTILSDAVVSQCGLLLGRHRLHPSCARNRIANVLVRGAFSQAGCIALAAESNGWTGCIFENALPGAHRCFVTAGDPAAVRLRSPLATPVLGPNTDNVMTDCEFYAPFDGAAPVVFHGAAGYTMQACTVNCGEAVGARLVTYRTAQDIFNGPVAWRDPHFEVFGRDAIVHQPTTGGRIGYIRGLNCSGGTWQVADGTTLFGAPAGSGDKAILQTSTWTTPTVSMDARTLRFTAYALTDCAIALRVADGVGDVEIAGFTENSTVTAGRLRIAQRVAGNSACL